MVANSPPSTANNDYTVWKGWDPIGHFGECSASDRKYFDAEVARLPVTEIRSVLELGFGNGSFLGFARSKGWSVTGVEAIESQVQVARERGFEAFTPDGVADITPCSLDLVVAFDVLEHIPQSDLPGLFATIYNKLRPGGLFLARFPNGDSPFGMPYQNGDVTHVTVIGSGKLRYFAQQAGLIVVYCATPCLIIKMNYWRHTLQQAVSALVVGILERLMRLVITPRSCVSFFSGNLIAILRRPELQQGA